MNTIIFNLGYILFSALVVWVFLANHFYLKIFFLKTETKKSKKEYQEKLESSIFDQVFGGDTVPQYIKDPILRSQDKYQLLSLYLASRSIIDLGVYNKVIKDDSDDKYRFCASLLVDTKHSSFNFVIWVARLISMLGSFWLLLIFFNQVFLSKGTVIYNNDQLIVFSVFIMFILMPYNIFSKSRFFDKLSSIFVLLSSVLVALYSVVYIQNYSGDIVFNKLFLSVALVNLIITIGAYSYIGYAKLEYMVKFFELLKVNLIQNTEVENEVSSPTVAVPSQATSS